MKSTAISSEPDQFEVDTAEARAAELLERMRETPMRRGALSKRMRSVRETVAGVIRREGVDAELAQRVAFQLAFKFHKSELGGPDVWQVMGRILRQEVADLQVRAGLSDAKISVVLPKLSAAQLLEFLEELSRADRRIARTILNAAVDAADPLSAGRRYLAEYRLVARHLRTINPALARTLANATFTAGMPLSKAIERLEQIASLAARQTDHPDVARLLARAGFRVR